ncbi:MAG: hypothetical protein U0228_01645 [Myxococcaceae bacterium]
MNSRAQNRSRVALVVFALLVILGWTALAAGVIAVFQGEPNASMHSHHHIEKKPNDDGPMLSDCPEGPVDDAGVCSA